MILTHYLPAMYKVSIYTGFILGTLLLVGGLFLAVGRQTELFIPGVDNHLVGGFFALYGAFRLWRSYQGMKQAQRNPEGNDD